MAQIQARAVDGWVAAEVAGLNGARVFLGKYHVLVVDAAGNGFKGLAGDTTLGIVNGAAGVVQWTGFTQVF